jgi:hypothetical protein
MTSLMWKALLSDGRTRDRVLFKTKISKAENVLG